MITMLRRGLCALALSIVMAAPAYATPTPSPTSTIQTADPATAEATHALSLYGTPKYAAGFKHFDYVNPDAPKSGTLRLAALQTFDTLNPYTLKGVTAAGASLPFETLMERSADEPYTVYGVLAASAALAPDHRSVRFHLRPQARFQDGTPVMADDVVFTFKTLLASGHPSFAIVYRDVSDVRAEGPREVVFSFKDGNNRQLPLQVAELPVLPRHAWQGKDFSATILQPLLGSGPYRVAKIDPGRSITYERVKDWWGANLPINLGRYNFDIIRYDYYRDETVQLEAFLAGRYDLRQENTAKLWSTGYTGPAVASGQILKQEIDNHLPAPFQAFVVNLRRPQFQDVRVREALDLAFDFEWSNKNIAFGAYRRTTSTFPNTELAAKGLPNAAERALLEPWRGKIPDAVFTQEYHQPTTDGSGNNRDNLRRAGELLSAAGWELKGGVRINSANGTPFTLTILAGDNRFERWLQPYFRNLERLGIKPTMRVVDAAQYQNRLNAFDFEMTTVAYPQSLSPGLELRDYWSSANASINGSGNLAGVRDAAVDALLEGVIAARDHDDLVAHGRALDRVLLWNHYTIPQWYIATYRLAFWDKFGRPTIAPTYGIGYLDQWWLKPDGPRS